MSTFDIIVLVLIGAALRNAIVGADTSFPGSFITLIRKRESAAALTACPRARE